MQTPSPSPYGLANWFKQAVATSNGGDLMSASGWFVLVDAAQAAQGAKALTRRHGLTPIRLFDGTFAEAAIELSPWLIRLPAHSREREELLQALDKQFGHLPTLGLLHAPELDDDAVANCLRKLMKISLDGEAFLWRFADAPSLQAVHTALTEEQRQDVFGWCTGWWTMDPDHGPQNWASGPSLQRCMPAPIELHEGQVQLMLNAALPSTLLAQMRSMDERFINVDHARLMRHTRSCVDDARMEALDLDTELLAWALEKPLPCPTSEAI